MKAKIISIVLAVTLLFAMAAPAMAAEKTGAPHVFMSDGTIVNAENENQLLVWLGSDRYQSLGDGSFPLDILEKIATDEGIELVLLNKTADANGFLRTKLMAGEIPDVIDGYGGFSDYYQMVKDGLLAELPMSLIEENMPNYVKWVEHWGGPDAWKPYEVDGKIYALANFWTIGNTGLGLGIREDLFTGAGATVPTTIDEWTDAMAKIKETYGIATISNYKDLAPKALTFVSGAYGAYPGIFYPNADGEIVFGSIQPEMKESLAVLADWYAKGYIDPEYTTLDHDNMVDKWNADKVAATVFYWWAFYPTGTLYGTDYWDVCKENPDAKVSHIDFPKGPTGLSGTVQDNFASMGPMFGSHMTEEQIARYLRFYDKYAFTPEGVNLLMAGIEGVHYNYDPEVGVVYIAPYDEEIERYKVGVRVMDCIPITLNDYDVQGYTNYNPKFASEREAGFAKGVGQSDVMAPYNRPIFTEKKEMLDKIAGDFVYDVMTGAKSVDEFDAFVESWLATGGQEVLDEANALWSSK